MDDEPPGPLTIGQLARRTGMPVRTIRYWSDVGVLPTVGRTAAGYRLYDAASLARLELIRTLRDLGLGLADVRRVVAGATSVAAVAQTHLAALDGQIRTLRLRRAVLSTVAKRRPAPEEMILVHNLARLSTAERRRIVAALNGEPAPFSPAADYAWLAAALRARSAATSNGEGSG